MRTWVLPLLIAAPLVAAPAFAQAPPRQSLSGQPPAAQPRDEIGELIRKHLAAPGDEDEADTVGVKRTAPEPEVDVLPSGPAPKVYTPAPRSEQAAPVNINELAKTPDAASTIRDLAYDARIRSSFASAQSFQGPLEGGWTLAEAAGGDHYALQIVDRRDRLEAVWRNVRRPGAPDASGLVDDIQRAGPALTLRFTEAPAPTVVLTLHEAGDGRWTGELARGEVHAAVTLRRTGP